MINLEACTKLLKKILGLQEVTIALDEKSSSYFVSLLKDFLRPREFQVLDWHFGLTDEKLTLQEIGERLGVSRERIRQIESTALIKLYHPSREWVFEMFLLDRTDLIKKVITLQKENELLRAEKTGSYLKEAIFKEALAISIENLDLSVRVHNCLRRLEVETLGDLVKKTSTDLLNVPNMGRKTLMEIENLLVKYGLSLSEEEGG